MTLFAPQNFAELEQALQAIVADKIAVTIRALGSKDGLGRQTATDATIDVSGLAGVMDYEPEELIITAHAGTPLAEIEALLASKNQMLAFEPPHYDQLYGTQTTGTIGGILMANLSGPRRVSAGAARDFLLGFQGVSGRGAAFRSGSKVVKNVTGYDLSKLLCGSFGTLAIMDEITLKTLPAPETSQSLIIAHHDFAKVAGAARAAMQSAHEASGAALLPQGLHPLSQNASIAVIRLEGVAISVEDRLANLQSALSSFGHADRLDEATSQALWADIRDVAPLLPEGEQIWRISLAPSEAPSFLAHISDEFDCAFYGDWAGGLIWLSCDEANAHALIRARLAKSGGGHATLMRAPQALRQAVPVFEPLPAALAQLNQRVQESFDPHQLLNPGRLS